MELAAKSLPFMRLGTDIVYVPRIQQAWERFGDRFLAKVYTSAERDYCLRSDAHTLHRLAGRWAAKEAAVKAMGTGWRGVGYTDVEICRAQSGAPSIQLHGRGMEVLHQFGFQAEQVAWQVSFTHDRDYAFATVLLVAIA
ncbi:holo-ACP synthase [Synechococcus sp. PCC 7336]|uniref:holo-ACP synthase n=1 Tax=Synechococcus sp. PCC 7336 TaxID=195250 RepID=UPI00034C63EF|nr:holo-ACP synthase [Synechococcus sp. PCC 7336]